MAVKKAVVERQGEPRASGNVIKELRRQYDRLTQSQKRIAQYIVEHSNAVAFSTVRSDGVATPTSIHRPSCASPIASD